MKRIFLIIALISILLLIVGVALEDDRGIKLFGIGFGLLIVVGMIERIYMRWRGPSDE